MFKLIYSSFENVKIVLKSLQIEFNRLFIDGQAVFFHYLLISLIRRFVPTSRSLFCLLNE